MSEPEPDPFEAELEAELVKPQKASYFRKANSMIASPIGFWLFTTLTVGLFGYLYSNYSSCQRLRASDESYLEEVAMELQYRSGFLYDLQKAINDKSANFNAESPLLMPIREELDGASAGLLSDLKEMPVEQLEVSIGQKGESWGLSDSAPFSQMNAYASDLSTIDDFRSTPAWYDMSTTDGREHTFDDFKEIASTFSGNINRDFYFQRFIPPSVCFRRALWPF